MHKHELNSITVFFVCNYLFRNESKYPRFAFRYLVKAISTFGNTLPPKIVFPFPLCMAENYNNS